MDNIVLSGQDGQVTPLIKSQLFPINNHRIVNMWMKRVGGYCRLLDRAAIPVDLGADLVQPWCNQDGKDGNYALCGQFAVNSIERMDVVFPQIQDGHPVHTIRSQTLYPLSYGCVVGI